MTDEAADAPEPEVVVAEIVDDAPAAAPLDPGIDLPEDPEQAVAVLLQAIATVGATADGYLADLQRVAAEYENYRKRTARERAELIDRSSQRVIEMLLPVLDSFDAAFTHEPQSPGEQLLLAGMQSTFHQLRDILDKEGLEMIPTRSEPFDPAVHEAMYGGGDGDLMVTEELRPGYTLGGRVLRPAMVVVGPDGGEEDEQA